MGQTSGENFQEHIALPLETMTKMEILIMIFRTMKRK